MSGSALHGDSIAGEVRADAARDGSSAADPS